MFPTFEETWFWVFAPVGFIFLISNWLLPLLWHKRVPPAARVLVECFHRKEVPALIVHDSGRSALVRIFERRGEGVVMTDRGKYRLLPRYTEAEEEVMDRLAEEMGAAQSRNPKTSQKTDKQKSQSTEEQPKEPKKKRLDFNTDWITRRSILTGLGLPFYVGYSGTLCLLNPECLAAHQAGEMFVPTSEQPYPTEQQKSLPKPLMLLDPRRIAAIINRSFDTTQIDAIIVDAEERGRLGRGLGQFLIPIGIIMLIVVVILIVIMSGGGGLFG